MNERTITGTLTTERINALVLSRTKTLRISEHCMKALSKQKLRFLSNAGITLIVEDRAGRPPKYSEKQVRDIILNGYGNNKAKMERLNMPERTYYAWKKKIIGGRK